MGTAIVLFLVAIFLLFIFLVGVAFFAATDYKIASICTGIVGFAMFWFIISAGLSNLPTQCPVCESKVEKTMAFCSNCGTYLHYDSTWYCENCEKEISVNQKYCSECGSSRDEWQKAHGITEEKSEEKTTERKDIAQVQ